MPPYIIISFKGHLFLFLIRERCSTRTLSVLILIHFLFGSTRFTGEEEEDKASENWKKVSSHYPLQKITKKIKQTRLFSLVLYVIHVPFVLCTIQDIYVHVYRGGKQFGVLFQTIVKTVKSIYISSHLHIQYMIALALYISGSQTGCRGTLYCFFNNVIFQFHLYGEFANNKTKHFMSYLLRLCV